MGYQLPTVKVWGGELLVYDILKNMPRSYLLLHKPTNIRICCQIGIGYSCRLWKFEEEDKHKVQNVIAAIYQWFVHYLCTKCHVKFDMNQWITSASVGNIVMNKKRGILLKSDIFTVKVGCPHLFIVALLLLYFLLSETVCRYHNQAFPWRPLILWQWPLAKP